MRRAWFSRSSICVLTQRRESCSRATWVSARYRSLSFAVAGSAATTLSSLSLTRSRKPDALSAIFWLDIMSFSLRQAEIEWKKVEGILRQALHLTKRALRIRVGVTAHWRSSMRCRQTPLEPAWIGRFRVSSAIASSFAGKSRWPSLAVLSVLSAARRLVFGKVEPLLSFWSTSLRSA